MDWHDLNLTPDAVARLRTEWGVTDPRQVVGLAWSMPARLEEVIPAVLVAQIRSRWPQSAGARFDSSSFALGARLGAPAAAPTVSPDFEARRNDLLARIDMASSIGEKQVLEGALVDLYRGRAAGLP